MNKRNFFTNLLLLIFLIIIVVTIIFLYKRIQNQIKKEEPQEDEMVLKDVMYDSDVTSFSFDSAETVLDNFINYYNDHNGEGIASIMNLVATYIYSGCEDKSDFDKQYEEKLSSDIPTSDLIIMQHSLKEEETGIIEGINNSDVQLTLLEKSDVEDTSKYVSKITAKIRTVSEIDNIDEIDTLEFVLLHRDKSYSIIEYDFISSEETTQELLEQFQQVEENANIIEENY